MGDRVIAADRDEKLVRLDRHPRDRRQLVEDPTVSRLDRSAEVADIGETDVLQQATTFRRVVHSVAATCREEAVAHLPDAVGGEAGAARRGCACVVFDPDDHTVDARVGHGNIHRHRPRTEGAPRSKIARDVRLRPMFDEGLRLDEGANGDPQGFSCRCICSNELFDDVQHPSGECESSEQVKCPRAQRELMSRVRLPEDDSSIGSGPSGEHLVHLQPGCGLTHSCAAHPWGAHLLHRCSTIATSGRTAHPPGSTSSEAHPR